MTYVLPGTTPSFCNFREYYISSSALRNQFQCPSKCFKKERDMFLPRHKSTKIPHFSHVFPLNFEVWNATDNGPIPGDKNYTKEQIVAKCPWPDDATQTIIIQIEHQELKEAENDLHSKHRSCKNANALSWQLPVTNDLCHRINVSYGFSWEVHENGSPIPSGFPGISWDPSEQCSMLLAAIYLHLSNMCRYTYIIHGASEHCFPF